VDVRAGENGSVVVSLEKNDTAVTLYPEAYSTLREKVSK
jgi:hypothetical protein